MKIDTSDITGLILAGGRGSRMGGVDKGLQPFRGEPMVAHVIRRLSPQVGTLMINANQNPDAYRRFGLPLLADQLTGFEGPLAGMQAGLARCPTRYMATVPCDSPFVPVDLVARLAGALAAADADLAAAVTEEASAKQVQPVFCLLKTSLLPQLTAYLEGGGRKIDAWHKSLNAVEVPFADASEFRNINTLDELRRYE